MYTNVDADNDIAYGLYIGCGFKEHSAESKLGEGGSGALSLGRTILLMATAGDG